MWGRLAKADSDRMIREAERTDDSFDQAARAQVESRAFAVLIAALSESRAVAGAEPPLLAG